MSSEPVLVESLASSAKNSIVGGPFGSNLVSKDYVPSGVPVIRGQNMGSKWVGGEFVFVSEEKASSLEPNKARPGDLVFTQRGTLGQVAIVPQAPYSEYIVSQSQMKLTPDLAKADVNYLYYAFLSPEQQDYIRNTAIQTGVPHTNLGILKKTPIKLPPLETQRKIAAVLGALDDRITLLRDANATLEAIAQALFKSWFVDFDPVRAKQEGRAPEGMDEATAALFPDRFEESELGLVPSGWSAQTLGDICSVTIGGLWGKDTKEDADLVPAISLRGVDLENLRTFGYAKDAPLRWVKPAAMKKRRVNEYEVLIASSGAGPCGRPLWAGADFESIYGVPVIFSNFVKRLDCGTSAKAIYVDRLLADMRESKEIWNFINGTSIPNLDDKLLLATKKVVLPADDVLLAFESIARAIYSKRYLEQAQTLATLRDTLLPRLISGQLRLPEAEQQVDEV